MANNIITTNADTIIDDQFDGKSAIYYTENDINKFDILNDKQVFHIHGSINKPEDMVFTTAQYLKRYKQSNFSKKIRNIFNNPDPNSVILIIGYSLSELQLLDLIVDDKETMSQERMKKTFLLNGYYSYQENVFEAEKEYYKTYGISLLSYSKDMKGYQGLADALIELDKFASSYSAKNIYQFQKFKKLFQSRPTHNIFDSFLNEFSEIDNDNKKLIVLNELKQSKYQSAWINTMFNNFQFYDKYLNIKKNLPLILKKEDAFPCCRFLLNVDENKLENKTKIKTFFRNLIEEYYNNASYFKNQGLALNICKTIMSNVDYISFPCAFEFIKVFNQQSYRDYCILYMCYDNDILLRVRKSILKKYVTLILNNFYENGDREYHFDLFYEKYINRLCTEIPNEVIAECEKIIKKDMGEKEPIFLTRDCFEQIVSNEIHNSIDMIYKVLLCCLKGVGDSEAIFLYKKYKNSNSLLFKHLSIYLVGIKYEVLEQLFFEDLVYYKNDRKYFTEIYSCFKKNVNNISQEKIDPILDFIDSIRFEKYTELWNITAKKYLLELFDTSPKFVNDDNYKLKCQTIKTLVSQKGFDDAIKTMPSPYNMSKSVWSSFTTWSRDTTLFNELKDLDNAKLFERLGKIELDDWDTADNVRDVLELRIPMGFINYLEENDLFSNIPFKLIQLIMQSFSKLDKDSIPDAILNIIKFVDSRTVINEKNILKRDSFSTIYYLLGKVKIYNLNSEIRNDLFTYSFDLNFMSIEDYATQNEKFNTGINLIFSTKAFEWLNILLITCTKEKWNKLKPLLDSLLNDKNRMVITKAAIIANTGLIWGFDSDYIKHSIACLFDNSLNGINYSHISFSLSMFHEPDFINLLSENGLLIPLIEDKKFELNWNLEYILIWEFLRGNIKRNIIENLLKCNCTKHAIYSVLNDFNKTNIISIPPNLISDLFFLISKTKFYGTDHCAVELYKQSKKLAKYQHYIDALLSLLNSPNNAYYSNDILLAARDSQLSDLDNEKIVSKYLLNLKDHYFYVDEIVNLIKEVKWSSNRSRLKIINNLSTANPLFLSKFDE